MNPGFEKECTLCLLLKKEFEAVEKVLIEEREMFEERDVCTEA